MIQNTLSGVLDRKKIPCLLEDLKINPKLRAENLSLKDYVRIYHWIEKTEREDKGVPS
jgi:16S rRNA A1518/A1519 N6-dimethyltransferase RsmA/KsgA/DIM1 with predicted DNA glycosylase/AP lyase activity